MKLAFLIGLVAWLAALPAGVAAQCMHFTQQHVDLLDVAWDANSQALSLAAHDDSTGMRYASNECVVVCPESMKFSLPGGTPLGQEGDELWILPQNPYAGVPYVGVSTEHLSSTEFPGEVTLRLTRVEGPGRFLMWQAGSLSDIEVRMDSRDGLSSADAISVTPGGHAHYNWGFTTSGVYRLYFQARATRTGETEPRVSPETPFTFHILPLRPFENWVATNWPCECATNVIAASADPDQDHAPNSFEYVFGTNPRVLDRRTWVQPGIVTTNGTAYGALTFDRAVPEMDAWCEVFAADSLTAPLWEPVTIVHSQESGPVSERLTFRDHLPVSGRMSRYFQLRVVFPYPAF